MFLKQLELQNPELIDYAFELIKTNKILPDTYVIDLEMIRQNTRKIVQEAKKYNIELLYMTKQIGRNPLIAEEIQKNGISNAVVVDFREAEVFMNNNLNLGNVGHLVQPSRGIVKKLLQYGTKYMTMYSRDNIQNLSKVAKEVNVNQDVLIKVIDKQDDIYPGQAGGFTLEELDSSLDEIKQFDNVNVVGITTFPGILFDEEAKEFKPTKNITTIDKAKQILKKHNIFPKVISLPSASATTSLSLVDQLGGNEAEPGHSLTGTTPIHAVKEQPEKPAYCYISEISHNFAGHSYVFGGGLYRRGHLKNAVVEENGKYKHTEVVPLEDSNIDYYLELADQFQTGSPVLMASRTQMFVTRSTVAVVDRLHGNSKPQLIGLFDTQGRKLTEGMK